MIGKLFLALALLAQAISGRLAGENCAFEFSQSVNTDRTLIRVAGRIAIIENGSESAWKGYVMSGQFSSDDPVTVTNRTGATLTKEYKDLPGGEQSLIDSIQREPMTGISIKISGHGDHVHYESTSENTLIVTYNERGAYKISGIRENVFVLANKMGLPYTHVFFQFGSVVTLVDSDCKNVEIVPYDKIGSGLKEFLGSKNFHAPNTSFASS